MAAALYAMFLSLWLLPPRYEQWMRLKMDWLFTATAITALGFAPLVLDTQIGVTLLGSTCASQPDLPQDRKVACRKVACRHM